MSTLEKKVEEKYDGIVIREFLKEELELSSRLIRRAAIEKRIFVNKEAVRMRKVLHTGDIVEVKLERVESQNIIPEKMELNIVYEDEDILVLNKPPYTVVHPTRGYPTGTLANGVLYYFNETNQNCIVRLVSRLDMDTSGLIIIAKNQYAHMALSKEMQLNHLEKRYLAVVHGHLQKEEGTIDLPIFKPEDEESIFKRIIDERGQRSITHYIVVKKFKDATLVECLLETGRTHQIRVHMASIGHPLVGDEVYGFKKQRFKLKGQVLHAKTLGFIHPKTKEYMEFTTDLPKYYNDLIEKLRKEV